MPNQPTPDKVNTIGPPVLSPRESFTCCPNMNRLPGTTSRRSGNGNPVLIANDGSRALERSYLYRKMKTYGIEK